MDDGASFTAPYASLAKVHYWKEGEEVQNFGDFLSEFFMQNLFLPTRRSARGVHIVGSVLDDMFIPSATERGEPVVFWGCGLRTPNGLSDERKALAKILAVRGPLSRSHARLGAQIPVGDPGFLLPALYQPKPMRIFRGKAVCIPHFTEHLDDLTLLSHSQCDLVLRPAIAPTNDALETFIDSIVAADFVLTASLHGAVVAAAYGRPFAFWDAGKVDLPFKWEDLAASMDITCVFHTDLQSGRDWYEAIRAKINLPEAWQLLVNPPFPLQTQAIVQVLDYYTGTRVGQSSSISDMVTDFRNTRGHTSRMAFEMAEFIRTADHTFRENQRLVEQLAAEKAAAEMRRLESQHLIEQLQAEGAAAEVNQQEKDNLLKQALSEAELQRLNVTMLQQAVDEEHTKVLSLRDALSNLRHQAEVERGRFQTERRALQSDFITLKEERDWLDGERKKTDAQSRMLSIELEAIYASTSWRATGVARRLAKRHPVLARFLRRVAKLSWWIGSGQLRQRLRQRAGVIAQLQAQNAMQPSVIVAESRSAHLNTISFHFDTSDRPKVVFIDSRYPRFDRDSGSVDTQNMIRILQSFGYEVAFVATAEFHEINSYGRTLEAQGVKIVTSSHFDSIQSFLKHHGKELSLGILSRVDCGGHFIDDMRRLAPQARVIFNTVDLHHVREEREAALKNDRAMFNEAYRMEERERYLVRMADVTFVVSSFDEMRCRELVPGADVVLMPILRGIPGRQAEFDERSGIGFIGGFEHKPNLDAVAYFLEEIWPSLREQVPELKFYVIGADMPSSMKELKVPGVEMVGFVPELDPWLNRLRLTVAPLRFGAGAKGKVVSSFSFGVPCVMSPIAAEGMGIQGEAEALIARDSGAYVQIISSLYENGSRWNHLSDSCLEVVEAQNSIERGRRIFERVLTNLNLPVDAQGTSL